jgi:phospholipid/cholesterol/gamma-HCH transport system substrate-binding protein
MKILKEVKIGLATIVAIVLFIWGFNFLKGKNIFSSTDIFYVQYDELGGLKESNAVLINGFQVGQVTGLRLADGSERKVWVKILVEDKYKIPMGSEARLFSADFMGTKAIELILSNSDAFHQDGDTLRSVIMLGLLDDMEALGEKVMGIASGVDSMVTQLMAIFDEGVKDDLKGTVSNLSNTAQNLDVMLSEDGDITRLIQKLNYLAANINDAMAKLPATMDNIEAVSDTLKHAEIGTLIKNTAQTMEYLGTILSKIEQGEGTAGKLVNNDSLYTNLTQTTKELELLLNDLRENPKRYVHFSVFGKKDKQ